MLHTRWPLREPWPPWQRVHGARFGVVIIIALLLEAVKGREVKNQVALMPRMAFWVGRKRGSRPETDEKGDRAPLEIAPLDNLGMWPRADDLLLRLQTNLPCALQLGRIFA
uniref:Putative secreted protein n=1 Tax=Anopheles triannulatus TaxID=58253 RepID=A0A2M4B5V1_9DIPT